MRFEVDKVALAQVFLPVLWFSPVTITPPMLHTYLKLHFPLNRRTIREACKLTKMLCSFGNRGALGGKEISLFVFHGLKPSHKMSSRDVQGDAVLACSGAQLTTAAA
jgi:hypothetical protein